MHPVSLVASHASPLDKLTLGMDQYSGRRSSPICEHRIIPDEFEAAVNVGKEKLSIPDTPSCQVPFPTGRAVGDEVLLSTVLDETNPRMMRAHHPRRKDQV